LREALGDSSDSPLYIETLPRVGYRFIGPVNGTPKLAELAANGARNESGVAGARRSLSFSAQTVATSGGDGRRSIAVVPFQFRAGAAEERFLSVALADAVANRLGSISSLVVRPTSSLLKYAGRKAEWTQIARELDVDLVAEGSIQKMGSRVRVFVQLWEVRGARSLHSAKVDGDMGDLFSLQDRLADSVFDALTPRVREKPLRTDVPVARHPLAFELYLRAVEQSVFYNKFELAAAIEMLDRAIALDPSFADAWGMLATICSQMGMHLDPNPTWIFRAEQAVATTLELDPVNCSAFCARAMVLFSPLRGFQTRPALRALNAALAINPRSYSARQFRCAVLFHTGFHDDACADFDEAILANPHFALVYAGRAYIAVYEGDYALAERFNQQALALEPALIHANVHAPLPAIYAGELGKAREQLRKARQMVPDEPQLTSLEGLILAREGDFKRAEQLADEAVANKRSVVHLHHSSHCAAGVYALCGKPEKAIAELKRCAETGLPNHRAFGKDPHLRSLQNHPDFIALMRELRHDFEIFQQEFGLSGANRSK
jgi:TolB-like protein/tetratricopeptide (TPR) repeat protein